MTTLQNRLTAGHRKRLFNLQSWEFLDGKARAILIPAVALEDIIAAIWGVGEEPVSLSLVEARALVGTRGDAAVHGRAGRRVRSY